MNPNSCTLSSSLRGSSFSDLHADLLRDGKEAELHIRWQRAVRSVHRPQRWPQPHIIAGGPLQRNTPSREGQHAVSHAAKCTDRPQLPQV
ncbi:hypothetical protein CEXT_406921 [Caerostris extrusa]|uniref:Uncharacterized protein n=1 Tax=Caerostris extrusa TaxID=172846 RepID=A0AAV4XVF2_CAEEX|nr:hypothetical protein CEXT_406921 [Caerostris extrusa]